MEPDADEPTIFEETGTIFLEPDIMSEADPTVFTGVTYAGIDTRTAFDRRVDGFTTTDMFLFNATFSDGSSAEVRVNLEFGSVEAAEVEAEYFAREIGRLPAVLREEMETITIHDGLEPFGGGNNDYLIHKQQAIDYINRGILHETLIHEGSHTSLDGRYADTDGWRAAQAEDDLFISDYARDNPTREDMAETFLFWFASRAVPERVDPALLDAVEEGNAARLAYFDSLALDITSVEGPELF
jgi:hypothetical protein